MRLLTITFFSFIIGVVLSILIFLLSPLNKEFHASIIDILATFFIYLKIIIAVILFQLILLFGFKTNNKISLLLTSLVHLFIILIILILDIQSKSLSNPTIYIAASIIFLTQLLIYTKFKNLIKN